LKQTIEGKDKIKIVCLTILLQKEFKKEEENIAN
jgi:hypothetical protein